MDLINQNLLTILILLPVIGAVLLSVLPELLRQAGSYRMIVVGFVLFGSMMGHTVPADPRYDPALRDPRRADAYETVAPFVEGNADTMYNFTKRGVLLICKDNAMRYGQRGARIATVSPGRTRARKASVSASMHPLVTTISSGSRRHPYANASCAIDRLSGSYPLPIR